MPKADLTPAEQALQEYQIRLSAALALKKHAIANNLAPGKKVCSQLNELSQDLDGALTAEKQNELDDAIAQLTKVTHPTGVDTVQITPDTRVRQKFNMYRVFLVIVGLILTGVAGWSYYSCRVAVLGGDLETRVRQLSEVSDTLSSVRRALAVEQLKLESALKDLDRANSSDEERLGFIHEEIADAENDILDLEQIVTDFERSEARAKQDIAWVELWPALLATTLGALGACTYLLYRLIGAYTQARITLTTLYSESMRLPVGAIVGWVLYVAFCQQSFQDSFLSKDDQLEFGKQSLLLLPFLAGYSSRLVVELLNRAIDGVRTMIGLQPSEESSA